MDAAAVHVVLDGVAQQVGEDLLDARLVAEHRASLRVRAPALIRMPRLAASLRPAPVVACTSRRAPALAVCRRRLPDSMRDRSSMSLIMSQQVPAGLLDLRRPTAAGAGGGGLRRSSSSSCAKPSIAFSGVRSSWLMRERNSLFARLRASAASRARSASSQPQVLGDVLDHADDALRLVVRVAQHARPSSAPRRSRRRASGSACGAGTSGSRRRRAAPSAAASSARSSGCVSASGSCDG